MSEQRVIGLIAGGRQFPLMVAKGVKRAGHRLVVATFPGHTDTDVAALADISRELKLGKLGALIAFFRENGVQDVVMAGTINKSKVLDVRHFDMRALKLIFRRRDKGDTVLLRTLSREFESEGMRVVPPHEFADDLLTPNGVLSRREPDERELADLKFGWDTAKTLGRLDIGQCVIVREGIVAAVEALEGTDAAVRRGGSLGGPGSVVVKVLKPGQQEQVDMPAVGADTVRSMAEVGATCLGVEAGRSLFFDRERALTFAADAGIAVVGIDEAFFRERGLSTE